MNDGARQELWPKSSHRRVDARRVQQAGPTTETFILATEWSRYAWLPGAAPLFPRSPPAAPPPAPSPRQGCAGPSWLESSSSLASSVTSVELLGEETDAAGVVPILFTVAADLPMVAGGGNCSANVQCNNLGGNMCERGRCRCLDQWRGLQCDIEVLCRAWVLAEQDWTDCEIISTDGVAVSDPSLVSCRCGKLGEMAVRAADWAPSLTWIDITEDWKLLLGLGETLYHPRPMPSHARPVPRHPHPLPQAICTQCHFVHSLLALVSEKSSDAHPPLLPSARARGVLHTGASSSSNGLIWQAPQALP